ncbi:hypothetical protein V8F33_010667 [Rhypophila sp. PSN 637]
MIPVPAATNPQPIPEDRSAGTLDLSDFKALPSVAAEMIPVSAAASPSPIPAHDVEDQDAGRGDYSEPPHRGGVGVVWRQPFARGNDLKQVDTGIEGLYQQKVAYIKEMFLIGQGELIGIDLCLEQLERLVESYRRSDYQTFRGVIFTDSQESLERLQEGVNSIKSKSHRRFTTPIRFHSCGHASRGPTDCAKTVARPKSTGCPEKQLPVRYWRTAWRDSGGDNPRTTGAMVIRLTSGSWANSGSGGKPTLS